MPTKMNLVHSLFSITVYCNWKKTDHTLLNLVFGDALFAGFEKSHQTPEQSRSDLIYHKLFYQFCGCGQNIKHIKTHSIKKSSSWIQPLEKILCPYLHTALLNVETSADSVKVPRCYDELFLQGAERNRFDLIRIIWYYAKCIICKNPLDSTAVPALCIGYARQVSVLLARCRSSGRSGLCTPGSGIWSFHGPRTRAGWRLSPESLLPETWPNIQLRPSHLPIKEQMWLTPVYVCVYGCQSFQIPHPLKQIQIGPFVTCTQFCKVPFLKLSHIYYVVV